MWNESSICCTDFWGAQGGGSRLPDIKMFFSSCFTGIKKYEIQMWKKQSLAVDFSIDQVITKLKDLLIYEQMLPIILDDAGFKASVTRAHKML